MSDIKRTCPACDSWTSAVGEAFRDGEPCPYCGLPAAAAHLIDEARERKVGDDVLSKYAAAEVRAAEAEAEVRELRDALDSIYRIASRKRGSNQP